MKQPRRVGHLFLYPRRKNGERLLRRLVDLCEVLGHACEIGSATLARFLGSERRLR